MDNRTISRATFNGNAVTFSHDPDASAIEIIRDSLGLTGTKYSCGAGVCGVCTVLVNGSPCVTCLTPAGALDQKEVTTIERFGAEDLHPVQRAFLVHDALQCGFCTPGFVVESIAFFDRWRAEHGKTEPSREQIAEALAGHLCRCGANVGIYEAVRTALRGDFDNEDPMAHSHLEHARRDGLEKVTGRARYTVDVQLPNMLVGKILSSPHAHALVKAVWTERANAIEGVKAIVTVMDDPHHVVRYVGTPILAVAAIDEETADAALAAIEIEYEVRPFVVDPIAARAPGAPVVYPERRKHAPNASEGPIPPGKWNGNERTPILNSILSKRRSVAARAVQESQSAATELQLITHTYITPAQTHTALEPHACVAHWTTPDHLTVYASTQGISQLQQQIAKRYKLKRENVNVISPYVGGAFGSKQGFIVENRAAIELAEKAGAPVKLVFSRLQEMTFGGCRPMVHNELSMAVDARGSLRGLVSRAYGYTGTAVQSQVAPWLRFMYHGPKDCRDIDVVTNTAPARPMRAPGGPAAFWALESAVDEVAHRLRIDPVALRRQWDMSDVRESLYAWVESIPEWKNRADAPVGAGRFRSGIGFAAGNWFSAYSNGTRVQIETSSAEGVVASCAVQDMGQGSRSVIARAVADTLGVPISTVDARVGNSDYVEGPICSASRATASLYPASIEAAELLRERLVSVAARELRIEGASWSNGGVLHSRGHIPLSELVAKISAQKVISNKRGANSVRDVLGRFPEGELGISLFPKMTGSVCVMSVDVDTRLGRIFPRKVWVGMSAGHIVNPTLADSQIYGAVIQNLGLALTEERHHDPTTGTLLTFGLEEYRIQGIADTPQIEIHYDQTRFAKMKGGASGLSELSTVAIAPALGNAVFHATGWRPTELPLTPERVLPALLAAGARG